MKNLLNFFFSFDKLFKEKLIVPFFWLALVVIGLAFLEVAFRAIKLPPLGAITGFINFWAFLLLALLLTRIVSELMVAIFRINDNLSPDKGKSELADIDPLAEARKAAEAAAAKTREATKSVSDKASDATKNLRENVGEMSETVSGKAKSATASVREKADGLSSSAKDKKESLLNKGDTSKTKPATKASKSDSKSSAKTSSKSTKKRGPKPGSKAPRDADGNLLKKDGTPRKKPGPKNN